MLVTASSGLTAWTEYTRRRERRDTQSDNDHNRYSEKIAALEEQLRLVRGRTHELANETGKLAATTVLRAEHVDREVLRLDREIRNLWHVTNSRVRDRRDGE